MLSQDARYRMQSALTDERVAAEVSKRLAVISTPGSTGAAQALLATMDTSKAMNDAIAERLADDMAGSGAQGAELSRKINGMVAVLKAYANGSEVPAVAAHFTGQVAGMTTNVTITAVVAGTAGNSISLSGDGVKSVSTLISDWNTAHAGNTATLSSGNGAQIPDAATTIALSGGTNASDADLAPAKAAMGSSPMSASAQECLVSMLTDASIASEVKSAYNAMIVAIQALS